jgi:LacI family transcriptional regulator
MPDASLSPQTTGFDSPVKMDTARRAITTRDVAAEAGVSQSTVSRALRNDSQVSARQRERIQSIAKKLGYRPNPYVAAFTAQVRHYRRSPQGAVIACVTFDESRKMPRHVRDYLEGARQRAFQLGYSTEIFGLDEVGHSLGRLSKVLRSRSISAVLFLSAPFQTSHTDLNGFSFEYFACAAVDPTLHFPAISRTQPDYYHAAQLALEVAAERGYRRIALTTTREEINHVGDEWLGGFSAWAKQLPSKHAGCRALLCLDKWGRQKFRQWLTDHRPDALVSNNPDFFRWATEAGFRPPDVAHISLGANPAEPTLAGVRQNHEMVGSFAIDSIVAQIHRNEYGIPLFPKLMMVPGTWCEGPSIRPV